MNQRGQRLKCGQRPFWKRILERHKFRGRWLRPRVPLVLLRFGSNKETPARPGFQPHVTQYALAVHIEFLWQQWLTNLFHTRLRHERFTHTALKETKYVSKEPRRRQTSSAQANPIARSAAWGRRNLNRIAGEPRARSRPLHPPIAGVPRVATVGAEVRRKSHGDTDERPVRPGPDSIRSAGERSPRTVAEDRSPQASRRNLRARQFRNHGINIPATLRLFSEKFLHSRIDTVLNMRHGIATRAPRITMPPQRKQRKSAADRTSDSLNGPAAGQQIMVRRDEVTDAVLRKVDMISRTFTPIETQLLRPARKTGPQRDAVDLGPSRLYAQSTSRTLAHPPAPSGAERSQAQENFSSTRPPPVIQPAQPQFDLVRLSEEVYRHIQRKVRIERERRGL